MDTRNHRKRPEIRPLSETETQRLEQALGAQVDREYLVHWVSQAIADAVMLASQPTPREVRDGLLQIERSGRLWLRALEESKAGSLLAARANLSEFRAGAATFCDRVSSLARQVDAVVRGHPRTSIALEQFVDRMIGIAKRAKVLPSAPSRAAKKRARVRVAGHAATRRRAVPTSFFKFLTTAIRVARSVIKTSALPDDQQAAALSKMRIHSEDALNKLVVKLRSRVRHYSPTPFGLVERKSNRSRS